MNAQLAAIMFDFYRCPTTGKVIEANKGDDKALCACGIPNPACPTERPHHHIVRFLKPATAAEYVKEKGG